MHMRVDPWLVLRTRCHQENAAEGDLLHREITTYLPRRSVVRRVRARKVVVPAPLFPGYVFIQPRVEQYEQIRYIRGSCGLVLSCGKPAEMPERDLAAVRVLVHSGASLAVDPRLIPGRRVEVRSGPFAGIQGELVRVKSVDRLVINAQLLSSSVSVEVDTDKIAIL